MVDAAVVQFRGGLLALRPGVRNRKTVDWFSSSRRVDSIERILEYKHMNVFLCRLSRQARLCFVMMTTAMIEE